jgi:hypothetical protein
MLLSPGLSSDAMDEELYNVVDLHLSTVAGSKYLL